MCGDIIILGDNMLCLICNNEFKQKHFNQKYCSENCKHKAKRISQEKYKKTEKGKISNQKWINSDRRKENEKKYRQNPIAKHKAVLRTMKYLENSEYGKEQKRLRDLKYSQSDKGKQVNLKASRKYRKTEKGKLNNRKQKYIRRCMTPIDTETIKEILSGDYYPELLKDYKKGNYIVWDKKSNEGMENNNFDRTLSSNFELCWSKNKHKKDIVRILWVSAFGTEQEFDHKRVHPTQKPTKLSRWFIDKYSKENQLIVDIYGGSGSTLIACEQLNRKCYMMELDPHYIDVIIQRWENFTGKKAVKLN